MLKYNLVKCQLFKVQISHSLSELKHSPYTKTLGDLTSTVFDRILVLLAFDWPLSRRQHSMDFVIWFLCPFFAHVAVLKQPKTNWILVQHKKRWNLILWWPLAKKGHLHFGLDAVPDDKCYLVQFKLNYGLTLILHTLPLEQDNILIFEFPLGIQIYENTAIF